MKKGKVYLVGAGPGDPGLITIRGLEILKKADTVLFDSLVSKELLYKTKPHAELILTAKKPKGHAVLQSKINRLMLEKVNQGKLVVRLKGGDPYIFGRGAEEVIYLKRRGIKVKVIPGVTSATAVPAHVGIPLTHRNLASSFGVMTGHRKKGYSKVHVPKADTLVYLMCVSNLERIVKSIRSAGWSMGTPCALIERGTMIDQKVTTGFLQDIAGKARRNNVKPPAVFVVGRVVDLRKRINTSSTCSVCV